MELYGLKSRSIPQKTIIHLIEILFLWLSFWILFQEGGNWCSHHLHIHNATNGFYRRIIIFSFNVIIFLRLAYMMFFLLERKIPWEESVSVPFAFALYYVGYTLLVLPVDLPIDTLDYFSIALFFTGCFLNTGSEMLRKSWKQKPEHKGALYTQGFFKYARHINYFGDLLWVTAYALMTRNGYAVSIPVFLFCFFAFYNAPKLDEYLKSKYGGAFTNYASTTKMLIPFIY
jgi:protein-S-isoprenylcysteine O-methyltransferase Ste14